MSDSIIYTNNDSSKIANFLEGSWINSVKRFLIFSSGTTGYPPYDYAVTEDDFWKDHPAPVYFGYGGTRAHCGIGGGYDPPHRS